MFPKNNLIMTTAGLLGLLLTLGAPILGLASPVASAATLAQDDAAIEPVTASRVAEVPLPGGASRASGAGYMSQLNDALGQVARSHQSKITRSEALAWTGDAARTALGELRASLKESGYIVAEGESFDSEAGRITPVSATRSNDPGRVVGMWIEANNGVSLLVWGRFEPETAPALRTAPQSVAALTKPTAAKKTVAKAKTPAAASSSVASKNETAAERQAKAIRAYQDYQYVKLMGPISGPMYRSSKW